MSNEEKKEGTKNTAVGCLGIIIIIGIVIFAFSSCFGSSDAKSEDNTAMIITIAQDEVKSKLKAPSTAKFPWGFSEYNIKEVASKTDGFNEYYVDGYVDAENSFGAKIRTRFIVKLELSDDGKKYKVLDIKLSE